MLHEDVHRNREAEAVLGGNVLSRPEDVVQPARRFPEMSGAEYSFGDISVVDLAARFRKRDRIVKMLTFANRAVHTRFVRERSK